MIRYDLALSLFAIVTSVTGALVSTGVSVTLDNINYYISPYSSGSVFVCGSKVHAFDSIHGLIPVSVVGGDVTTDELPDLFLNWTARDDVFQPAFLPVVFRTGGESSFNTTLTKGITTDVLSLNRKIDVPSGPYFFQKNTGELFPVYRLYDDFAGAFTEALLEKPDQTYQPLSAKVAGSATLSVGVPSRLYYTRTPEKPLAGVRIAVKDLYDIAGAKSPYGSRAYYNLYPPRNTTATPIARLIQAGAVIVGHQKTSQFANGEKATADWVDYISPFNPRGDGYQDPASSSVGAGASMASYEWLDAAVGSDTAGSIRQPSHVQGLFGNRPSHGLVPLEHTMPLSTVCDTSGFLIRDPALWDTLNSVVYDGNYTSLAKTTPKYPKRIITFGSLPNPTTEAGKIFTVIYITLAL